MNKQDWYLNKLNITQYILRNPYVVKGEAKINIADNIRLLIVCKTPPDEKIFHDILRAIHINYNDCLMLTPAQLSLPIKQLDRVIWFIDEPLPESWQTIEVTNKPIIKTTSLTQLALSPLLKRQLWQKLCQYEDYFKTQ